MLEWEERRGEVRAQRKGAQEPGKGRASLGSVGVSRDVVLLATYEGTNRTKRRVAGAHKNTQDVFK